MAKIRMNGVVWETGARSRPGPLAMAGRALGIAAAACGLGLGLAGMGSPVEAARGGAGAAPSAVKDAARLPPAARGEPERIQPAPFAPAAVGVPAGLAGGSPQEALREAARFAPPVPAAWQDGEFAQVAVVDGRTLRAGALLIRLEGLELPAADEACRTVDGRREPCAQRAATLLELTTRWRTLSCRYRLERPEAAVGACRLGTMDLAERMARTGVVRRAGAPVRPALAAEARPAV